MTTAAYIAMITTDPSRAAVETPATVMALLALYVEIRKVVIATTLASTASASQVPF